MHPSLLKASLSNRAAEDGDPLDAFSHEQAGGYCNLVIAAAAVCTVTKITTIFM
jgi:hypothetical protein